MRNRHHRRTTDLGLRLIGALLCAAAWLAIRALMRIHVPAATPPLIEDTLAAIGFISASAGAALIAYGHTLFEEVEVADRWKRRAH